MFAKVLAVLAIAFFGFVASAQAQVSQRQPVLVIHNMGGTVNIVGKSLPQLSAAAQSKMNNAAHAKAIFNGRAATVRMVGTNYVGTETGIEGIDFNRK